MVASSFQRYLAPSDLDHLATLEYTSNAVRDEFQRALGNHRHERVNDAVGVLVQLREYS